MVVSFSSGRVVESARVLERVERSGEDFIGTTEKIGMVPGHVVDLNLFAWIGVRDFESYSPHADASVGAYGLGCFHAEEIVDVHGGVDLCQRLTLVGEFSVERGHAQG